MTGLYAHSADLGPWDPNEFRLGLNRPVADQTPIPRVGDRVLVRIEPFAPLVDAQVLDVQDPERFRAADTYDHHLWRVVTGANGEALVDELGRRVTEPHPDPWPWLLLATPWGRITIREGRVRGSQGWWPLDWARRWYPAPGGRRLVRAIDEKMPA